MGRNFSFQMERISCPHCGDTHPWSSADWSNACDALCDSPDATRVLVDGQSATTFP